ncbi:hypothetical protein WA026_013060 [Henosepilachna vigintioctopunctata]|uniref:Anaphase-promoting complex subunit 4 n=1 Tax=Henosepilachna vigintioctopunctata TaxID=420089 RepID=A0AAW1UAR5_9CUCU
MDNKLFKFASKCPNAGVTADFLDLLMFGIYSSNMEGFLLNDLTKKGLEKFGQSIEMSYSTIQELLLKYVTKYGQSITYHLAELRGMVRLKHKYDVIGILESDVSEAILSTGAFLIKAGEMHQIINQSIINYKAFFRWLYTAIMHLLEEQIPPEIPKMTQQDLAYITEFFQNFDYIDKESNKRKGFIMERLGQYLSDTPLTLPPKMSGNEWSAFLRENNCLTNDSMILKHNNNMSLVQQFNKLRNDVTKMFSPPEKEMGNHFQKMIIFNCFAFSTQMKMSNINLSADSVLFSFLKSSHQLTLLEISFKKCGFHTRSGNFYFSNEHVGNVQEISDNMFYSPSILSLLLQDHTNQTSILYQFPITFALDNLTDIDILNRSLNNNFIPSINGSNIAPKVLKDVEMIVTQLAVSGTRKVGIVLSENKRKVKLFEMEGEEEDDEDADMSMNTTSPRISEVSDAIMQET